MKLLQPTNIICPESKILEQLLTLDNKNILELGCGKADITRLIARSGHGRTVTATEVDERQHAANLLITDLPNVTFVLAGSEDIPLDDESIDIVMMFKSFHHVPIELMDKALQEVKRILKPGGLVYVSEPIFDGDFNAVLRLFHDEEKVRKAAFNALERAIEDESFILLDEVFFKTPIEFDNFEDYEHKVINVTHTNHRLSADLLQTVKQQFSLNMVDDGVKFLINIRVDLLQKPS